MKVKRFDDVHIKSKNLTGVVYAIKGKKLSVKTVKGMVNTTLDDVESVNLERTIMKKSELKEMIREEIKALLDEEYDRSNGHFTRKGKDVYVDTNFINRTKGVLSGTQLKHLGFGEFYLEFRDGTQIDFIRWDSYGKQDGFVGRAHKLGGDDKAISALIKAMEKAKKAQEI